MKPELLQPLLLDRALGELSPEVSALLDAYLAGNPEAGRLAAEFDRTVVAARAAMSRDNDDAPPAFEALRCHHIEGSQGGSAGGFRWFQLAACLAVGAAAGWFVHSFPEFTPRSRTDSTAYAAADPVTPPSSAGLWSRNRIVASQTGERASGRLHVSRASALPPFTRPSSRQDQR